MEVLYNRNVKTRRDHPAGSQRLFFVPPGWPRGRELEGYPVRTGMKAGSSGDGGTWHTRQPTLPDSLPPDKERTLEILIRDTRRGEKVAELRSAHTTSPFSTRRHTSLSLTPQGSNNIFVLSERQALAPRER